MYAVRNSKGGPLDAHFHLASLWSSAVFSFSTPCLGPVFTPVALTTLDPSGSTLSLPASHLCLGASPLPHQLLFFTVVCVCGAHDTIHPAAQAGNPELVINLSATHTIQATESIANGTGPFITSPCGNPGGGWGLLQGVCHMDTVSTVEGRLS